MTKPSIILNSVVCVGFLLLAHSTIAAPSVKSSLPAEAERLADTPAGDAYVKVFSAAVAQRFVKARDEGMVKLKLRPPILIDVTFLISASGQITDTIIPAKQPLSAYIAQQFKGSQVPKPPRDAYPVRVRMHAAAS